MNIYQFHNRPPTPLLPIDSEAADTQKASLIPTAPITTTTTTNNAATTTTNHTYTSTHPISTPTITRRNRPISADLAAKRKYENEEKLRFMISNILLRNQQQQHHQQQQYQQQQHQKLQQQQQQQRRQLLYQQQNSTNQVEKENVLEQQKQDWQQNQFSPQQRPDNDEQKQRQFIPLQSSSAAAIPKNYQANIPTIQHPTTGRITNTNTTAPQTQTPAQAHTTTTTSGNIPRNGSNYNNNESIYEKISRKDKLIQEQMKIIQELLNQVDTLSKLSSSAGGGFTGGSSTRRSQSRSRGGEQKKEEVRRLAHLKNRIGNNDDDKDDKVDYNDERHNDFVDKNDDDNEDGNENEFLVSFDQFFAKSGKISPLTIEKEDDIEII